MPGKTFRGWSLVSDRAGVTLPCDGVFTGHVWITIWAQSLSESSRDPTDHRHLSWSKAVGPFMPAGLVPGTAPPSGRTCTVHPQALCTATYTHDLARAGVIGACSHAGPGSRASLPRAGVITLPGGHAQACCTVVIYVHTAVHRLWVISQLLRTFTMTSA